MKPELESKFSLKQSTLWRYSPALLAILLLVSTTSTAAQTTSPEDEKPLSREEILALFEREARAAYAMAKETCEQLSGEEQKQCLAKARLQYDADRRYARKRAEQGY
jgi:hypothetical protein